MTEFAGNCQNVNFADPKTVILADLYSFNKTPTCFFDSQVNDRNTQYKTGYCFL